MRAGLDPVTPSRPDPVPRAVVGLSALAFLGFGAAFLVVPARMAAHAGLVLDSPASLSEVRALYGGLEVGVGLFLGIAARRRSWLSPALALLALAFSGMVAARLGSLVVDGPPAALVLGVSALECAGLLVSLWAFRREARSAPDAPRSGTGP